MLVCYAPSEHCLVPLAVAPGADLPAEAVWIDLINPTREEELLVERTLQIEAPTREEMQEIEVSNRLYTESGAVFMTATVMSRMDSDLPLSTPVTFIVKERRLVTLRYAEPRPFASFMHRVQRPHSGYTCGPLVFAGLMEAVVNRLADVLEGLGNDVDVLSREVFSADKGAARRDFQEVLRKLGRKGDLTGKVRESLVSLARATHFAVESLDTSDAGYGRELSNRIKAVDKDVVSLLDHTNFQSSKISFLLDATLGLINIEQNAIIKLFSVVSVAMMPPTLIASIYGMNFDTMPELSWEFGYPMAVGGMVISAVLPLLYFRRKGWL